jgi:cation:H+ antiporter
MQIAILAVVDLVTEPRALTFFTPQPVLLFQGVMLLLLLSIAIAGVTASEPIAFFGFGLTPVILVAGYILTVRWSRADAGRLPPWRATNAPEQRNDAARGGQQDRSPREIATPALYARSAAAGAAIVAAGWALAQSGDALSNQTGLGASFVGVALVAASTSLPELSTSLGAVRHGNHQMAVSNILGTNCLEVALFFVADFAYRGGPILAETDRAGVFAASTGLVVTGIYLLGLLERRDRTFLRMGYDSIAVLIAYGVGLAGVYMLG